MIVTPEPERFVDPHERESPILATGIPFIRTFGLPDACIAS
jgi:hypothetical protein